MHTPMSILLTRISDGFTIFSALLAETIPFILLGTAISTILTLFVRDEALIKFVPKNRYLSILSANLFGFLFPVCECGNIPVAKRLMQKGLSPHIAIAFLLSAPVLNPIVIATTFTAFKNEPRIAIYRLIFSFLIAYIIGLILSYHPKPAEVISEKASHTHKEETCALPGESSWRAFVRICSSDFVMMLKNLIFGALLATIIQLILSQKAFLALGDNPIISVFVMVAFAAIISVCSTVDAFIALAYRTTFTSGSIVAFLIFGPLFDIKSLFLMRSALSWKFITIVTSLALLLSIIFGLLINIFG